VQPLSDLQAHPTAHEVSPVAFEAIDPAYWQNLVPPYAPNADELALYRSLVGAATPVCLLGMTRDLVPLCDVAADLNPIAIGKPVLKCDWNALTGRFGAVIGDGVLNLAGPGLVQKVLAVSDRLVARVFMKKQPLMRYATIFPTEFPGSTAVYVTQPDIAVVVWDRVT
jgi:hypothetical protein